MTSILKVEKYVRATPEKVYFAFTHAISLMEWLCDYATVAPHPGGRIYLWWQSDFYTAGEFISLEEDKSIIFTWHGRNEPFPSRVAITLEGKDDATLVRLVHTNPEDNYWKKNARCFPQGWENSLANLAQVLETGLDKRMFERPMLGINISDFSPSSAKAMGVPVCNGLRLDFLPEEMGAYKAGLRKDDVIISLNGRPISDEFNELASALRGKKVGDKVKVEFYRGPEKRTLTVDLTKRTVPQISWVPSKFAEVIRTKYDEGLAALEKCFEGATDSDTDRRPAPGEWNAKEVLAHLIQTERHWLENLDDVVGGYPRISDGWTGNSTLHVSATATAYKTVRVLLDELRRLSDEMVLYVASLPQKFVAHKASYLQVANLLLEGSLPHIFSHIGQIQSAIANARKK